MADRFSNRPSFADNFDRGVPRQGADAPSDGDPLAELARLIGQTDPQANFARGRQANPPQAPRSLATDFSAGPPSWVQAAQAQQSRSQPAHVEHEPHHEADPQPQLTPMPAFLQQAQHPQHAHQPAPNDRYDQVLYDHDGQQQQYEEEEYDEQQGYADEEYAEEQLGSQPAFLENENRRRRPGGLLTVAVVLGLAVIGTAGAYAYRSYSGSPRGGTPPVIKADNAPSKVVPPTQSSDNSGKLIYDRIGNGGGPERVVSREEQPVDVNANAPRSVFPGVGQSGAPMQQASNAADDGADSPRKIRTVPIRSDQANGTPLAPKPAPPVPTAVRTVPVQAAAQTPPAANTPMSLSPSAPAAPNSVRSASAAVPPPAAAPPTNVTRTTGAYLVQIASQKSEAEAQASYRAAQAKYANLIGSMSPIIKRADLGEKGIYYRAMVGPFQTSDEATKFCSNLKVAGGSCVVQRN